MSVGRAGRGPTLGGTDYGGVTDPELIRRAENAGIAASYENWRHERVEVPAETLAAILAALEESGTSINPARSRSPRGSRVADAPAEAARVSPA